jgi:hypothetical protein
MFTTTSIKALIPKSVQMNKQPNKNGFTKVNGPFEKEPEPCKAWDSAQQPEENGSVCFNCGWTKPNHGETNDSVQIWYFHDKNVPEFVKAHADCGGDEDWIILAPISLKWEFDTIVEKLNRYESNPFAKTIEIIECNNKTYLLHTICHA